jgi:hypothetical protein
VAAEDHSPGLIQVDAFSQGQGGSAQVVVTIQNMTTRPICTLRIELWTGAKLAKTEELTALSPGQSTVVHLATTTPEQSYIVVTARSGASTDQLAVAPESEQVAVAPESEQVVVAPESESGASGSGPSALLVGVVSSLLSLLAVVVGTVLTHVTTSKREQRQRSFEARKGDTERYSAAYREFLDYWNAGTSPTQLENGFASLRGKAFVPADILRLYETTLATLRDNTASQQAKADAARRLYEAVDAITATRSSPR